MLKKMNATDNSICNVQGTLKTEIYVLYLHIQYQTHKGFTSQEISSFYTICMTL